MIHLYNNKYLFSCKYLNNKACQWFRYQLQILWIRRVHVINEDTLTLDY